VKETEKEKEKDKEPKICPILMAGAMIDEIHTQTDHTTVHRVYHDSVLCLGDKCEWYDNGCPAHPRLEFEPGFQPGRIYASD